MSFYGGDPNGLMQTPVGLARVLGEQIPKLQAEQQIRAVMAVQAGSGHMNKNAYHRYMKGLRRQTGQRARVATAADIRASGGEVINEPKKGGDT